MMATAKKWDRSPSLADTPLEAAPLFTRKGTLKRQIYRPPKDQSELLDKDPWFQSLMDPRGIFNVPAPVLQSVRAHHEAIHQISSGEIPPSQPRESSLPPTTSASRQSPRPYPQVTLSTPLPSSRSASPLPQAPPTLPQRGESPELGIREIISGLLTQELPPTAGQRQENGDDDGNETDVSWEPTPTGHARRDLELPDAAPSSPLQRKEPSNPQRNSQAPEESSTQNAPSTSEESSEPSATLPTIVAAREVQLEIRTCSLNQDGSGSNNPDSESDGELELEVPGALPDTPGRINRAAAPVHTPPSAKVIPCSFNTHTSSSPLKASMPRRNLMKKAVWPEAIEKKWPRQPTMSPTKPQRRESATVTPSGAGRRAASKRPASSASVDAGVAFVTQAPLPALTSTPDSPVVVRSSRDRDDCTIPDTVRRIPGHVAGSPHRDSSILPEPSSELQPEPQQEPQPELQLQSQSELEFQSQPEPQLETEPEQVESQLELQFASQPELQLESQPEPQLEPQLESEPEQLESPPEPQVESQPEPRPESDPGQLESPPELEFASQPELQLESQPEPQHEPQPEPQPEVAVQAEAQAAIEDPPSPEAGPRPPPYDAFTLAYPDYRGDLQLFLRACFCIRNFQDNKKRHLMSYEYDNVIRAFIDYVEYVDECGTSAPLSFVQWYVERDEGLRYAKGIVTRQNFDAIMEAYPAEAELIRRIAGVGGRGVVSAQDAETGAASASSVLRESSMSEEARDSPPRDTALDEREEQEPISPPPITKRIWIRGGEPGSSPPRKTVEVDEDEIVGEPMEDEVVEEEAVEEEAVEEEVFARPASAQRERAHETIREPTLRPRTSYSTASHRSHVSPREHTERQPPASPDLSAVPTPTKKRKRSDVTVDSEEEDEYDAEFELRQRLKATSKTRPKPADLTIPTSTKRDVLVRPPAMAAPKPMAKPIAIPAARPSREGSNSRSSKTASATPVSGKSSRRSPPPTASTISTAATRATGATGATGAKRKKKKRKAEDPEETLRKWREFLGTTWVPMASAEK